MLNISAIFFILAAGFSHVSGQETPKKSIAYVYYISGQWRGSSQPAHILKAGDGLQQEDVLQAAPSEPAASISIGFVDGTIHTEACASRIQDCSYVVKNQREKTGENRAGMIIKRLFNTGPSPIVFAISRSANSDLLREAVIHAGPSPDLSSMTGTLSNGSYEAVFRNGESLRPVRIACEWKDKAGKCGGLLPAGLYQIQLEQDGDVLAGPVAVFAADMNFQEAAALFRDAANIVKGWPSDTPSGAKHYFLASVVTELARGQER